MMRKRAIVTGGKGFIGSHMVEQLHKRRYSVRTYDIVDGQDIRDKYELSQLVREFKPQVIFNLAGILGTHELIEGNIKEAFDIIVGGAINCLDIGRDYGVRVVEIGKPNIWLNVYSITKHAAENLTAMYYTEFGVEAMTVKWFNAYGERQHYGKPQKLAPTAIVKALRGEDIPIFGSGEQTMDNIYAVDAANACIDLYETKAWGEAIEVGSGEDITVNDFVDLVLKLTGSKSKKLYLPMRRGEDEHSIVRADTERLKELTKFKPKYSLEEGLIKTINWYKNEQNI